MMKIDSYAFGRIIINGQAYTSDVIIYHDRVDASWWRGEGHRLQVTDLTAILNAQPDILIVGTGQAGVMNVPREVASYVEAQGIEIKVERTAKAVDLFNSLQDTRKYVIAALHITC